MSTWAGGVDYQAFLEDLHPAMLNGGDMYVEIEMSGMSGVSNPVPRTFQKFGRIFRGFAGMAYSDGKSRDIAQSGVCQGVSQCSMRGCYICSRRSLDLSVYLQ